MRIAIDCRMIHCSGIGTFLQGVLNEFVKHPEINFLLVGNVTKLSEYNQNNVEILSCDIPIFTIKELIRFPVNGINKCDCFFSPNYNIPAGIKVPVFSTIHDVLFLDFPGLTNAVGRIVRRMAINRAISLSDHIFTVSEFSRSRILKHSHKEKPISVCYNGADNIMVCLDCKSDINISGEYYIYVGNIKPHKGLGTLLDAFEQPEVLNSGRKLVIVGNKDNFKTSDERLSKRISELSSSNKVIFTGYVDNNSLVNLLRNAYCLIQPSEYEGFGLPPLEAMNMGTPVILSDIPVFKELYHDFPVAFFKTSDAKSLAQAMVSPLNHVNLSEDLKYKYTYKNTANIILSDIKSYLSNHENSTSREILFPN